ncbi:type II secretion system F family protein [Clostridium paridis]|uniref:Type II secretion system F family protein n=1 Tax=Clostridium paridis TaxID=2803863 RepID=A0A937K3C8_9CLOT|nr:type II secretion system F family protein [Clostridium paridis]MBL4932276.1 type II secretion system F family protein [Clostridium paridis]
MQLIKIATFVFMIIISVICFILVKGIFTHKWLSKIDLKKADGKFKESEKYIAFYKNIEKHLKQMGFKEIFGKDVTPTEFMLVKIVLALVFSVGVLNQGILWSIALGIIAYFLPDVLIRIGNSVDNEEILPDLKRVYDTLRIQTKAGVFLTMSLTECYLSVKTPRLKKALLELNSYILTKSDIDEAVEDFNSKFKSPYIDTFCIVIKQSVSSGKTVEILEDLSEQISDIQDAINLKLAERVKAKLQFQQLLIYIGVIAIVVYSMFIEILSSLSAL